MTQHQTNERNEVAAEAATHACSVLRQALAMTSRGTVRDTFDQAVTREVAHMLEGGSMPTAVAAFEGAAAVVHHALSPDGAWPCVACGDE